MGRWTNHCSHCRPSEQLREDFDTLVASVDKKWEFEVICENGSLGLPGMPRDIGTFVIGAYIPGESKVVPELTIAFTDDERWVVRVRSEHRNCAMDAPDVENRLGEQIRGLRSAIHAHHTTFRDWNRMNNYGDLSVSVFRRFCANEKEAINEFLEACDLIIEKGWTSKPLV